MKDLAGEPSSLYSQVAKYRFKNPASGEGNSVGVSVKVESNPVSAGTLSSNVKNLAKCEKPSAAPENKAEGQSSTSGDTAGTSSTEGTEKPEPSGATDAKGEHSGTQGGPISTEVVDVPPVTQVDTSKQTEEPAKLSATASDENPNPAKSAVDTASSTATSKDTSDTSGTSKDTDSTSPPTLGESSKPFGTIGGLVAFLESVRSGSSNTKDLTPSDITVTSTSETGTKTSSQDKSSDEKSSEVATSQDDKQSNMIYTMTR